MMEGPDLHLSLLLVLGIWAPAPASASLEGSCVAAGITECCDPVVHGMCFAPPTYCLCDPSCREHSDCCEDIDEICQPDYPEPVAPALLLAVDLTFHTATLLWAVPAEAGPNQTYTVLYWGYGEPNTSLSLDVSGGSGEVVEAVLTGLGPGLAYQWAVEATSGDTSAQSALHSFTTPDLVRLEELSVRLYNTSAVVLSWAPPQLPFGAQLTQYIIHYTGTRTPDDSPNVLHSGRMTVSEASAVVGGLNSNVFYHFWVQAVVVEGDYQSEDVVSAENVTIFVPDSAIVQLRGGPFKPCHGWTVSGSTV
jgi:hypothetical protein